jgi:acylphosphatase
MANQQRRLHAFVSGRVQGVGFRHFVLMAAQDLDLSGWVRNLWDGRVELIAEGSPEDLDNLMVQIRRGPASARVIELEENWDPPSGEFTGFHVRGTQ